MIVDGFYCDRCGERATCGIPGPVGFAYVCPEHCPMPHHEVIE